MVYNGIIRNVMENCAAVYTGAPQVLFKKYNRIQKHAHRIICGEECSCDMMKNLEDRRMNLAVKLFLNAADNKSHILNKIMPCRLKHTKKFHVPFCKTNRSGKTFIPFTAIYINNMKH